MNSTQQANPATESAEDLDNQHGWEGVGPAVVCALAFDLLMVLCAAWLAGLRWSDVMQVLPG